MCKLRVIRKNRSEISSSIIDCENVSLNPIDRPAYVLISNKNEKNSLDFAFSNDKEPKKVVEFKNGSIEYGVNSGRIYSASINSHNINETDFFQLRQNLDKSNTTDRFSENIKSFKILINKTLQYILNNPLC